MVLHATGNYKNDVTSPFFQEGESRVMRAIAELLPDWTIEDRRHLNHHGDFALVKDGRSFLCDVKVDQKSTQTGRFAWEEKIVYPDGHSVPGWGTRPELDYVIFVSAIPGSPQKPWEARVIDAKALSAAMQYYIAHKPLQTLRRHNWYPFDKHNDDGKRGVGWAVPKDQLLPLTRRIFPV